MNTVISNKDFNVGDVVERCSLSSIRVAAENMNSHIFYINKVNKYIPDGNACLYAHQESPNLKYSHTNSKVEVKNNKPKLIPRMLVFSAIKKIKKGEELTINYRQSGVIKKEWSNLDGLF